MRPQLTREQLLRAWKDPAYRATLSAEEMAQLREIPTSLAELSDEELEMIAGGSDKCDSTCSTSCVGSTAGVPPEPL